MAAGRGTTRVSGAQLGADLIEGVGDKLRLRVGPEQDPDSESSEVALPQARGGDGPLSAGDV